MMLDPERPIYVISVFAEIVGVHPQTLRNYERIGLLSPKRTRGGSRRFSRSDLERALHIMELTAEGINLAGVRRILALEDALSTARSNSAPVVALVPVPTERSSRTPDPPIGTR